MPHFGGLYLILRILPVYFGRPEDAMSSSRQFFLMSFSGPWLRRTDLFSRAHWCSGYVGLSVIIVKSGLRRVIPFMCYRMIRFSNDFVLCRMVHFFIF